MAYGLTKEGFIPKRTADIIAAVTERIRQIQDPKTGEYPFISFADDTILQQLIAIHAQELNYCWSAAANLAWQFDPLKATNACLSGLVQLNGITRRPGSATYVPLTITAAPGALVSTNDQFSDLERSVIYKPVDAATVPASGTLTFTAESAINGPFDPAPNTIIQVLYAESSKIYTVTNAAPTSIGTLEETDVALRARQQKSTGITGYRLVDAIAAGLLSIPGVQFVKVYQNALDYPADANGIPFKEVSAVVYGGLDKDIAEKLFRYFPTGQQGYGNTTVTVLDQNGLEIPMSFTRPQEIPIYVKVEVEITDATLFDEKLLAQIPGAIVAFVAQGGQGDPDGVIPGENVYRSRLYTPLNEFKGVAYPVVQIGLSASAVGDADIPIAWNQLAMFDESRITVTLRT